MEIVIVKYSDLFDERAKDPREYLQGISRTMLLTACAHFISMIEYKGVDGDYAEFICNFFSPSNTTFAHEIINRLNKIQKSMPERLTLINIPSSLELFEYCFDNISGEEDFQTSQEAEINVFKAVLIFNEYRTQKEMLASKSTKDANGILPPAQFIFSHSCPTSDIENFYLKEVFITQIIKAILLFEFLESDKNLKSLLAFFLAHFNCRNSQDYLSRVMPLAFPIMAPRNFGTLKLNLANDDAYKASQDFIEKFSLMADQISDVDYKSLRSQPFYKINDYEYLITFDLFVLEMIFKGLYFKLNYFNSQLPKNEKKAEFRSYYTMEFSEKYLVYTIMTSLFGKRFKQLSGERMRLLGASGEPDYYIRNGNHVFIFESKDILLEANIKLSYDYAQYETELRKKFFEKIKNGKPAKTAIKQLIESAIKVLHKELPDKDYKEKNVIIYPIIILHDQFWNIAGLNQLLNQWFNAELITRVNSVSSIENVRPLVIISTDTLLLYQDLFREKKIRLEEVLEDYYNAVEYHSPKNLTTINEVKEAFYKRLEPFSLFLRNYINDKGFHYIMPKMLLSKSMGLLTPYPTA